MGTDGGGMSALTQVQAVVHERSGGRCEVGIIGVCTRRAVHVHHCLRGNPRVHAPSVMLAVCAPCHDHIHAHPAEAYARGWLIRRGAA